MRDENKDEFAALTCEDCHEEYPECLCGGGEDALADEAEWGGGKHVPFLYAEVELED